jgi:hypothetical protein
MGDCMAFLSGSVTFERYWITKDSTPEFGVEHLEILEKHKISSSDPSTPEQPAVGFLAGGHLLDTQFDLAKNLIGDALHFGIRIDTNQIPGPIRKAWLQIELLPFIADSPSGKPTKAQREEAKEAVEARCEAEAASGKFRRMQYVPVLWDAPGAVLYLGGTSSVANELCIELMERTFELEFDRITSGKLAKEYALEHELVADLHKTGPSPFHSELTNGHVEWWNGMAENYDYLGNEFLMWLWWYFETESDTVSLRDSSEVSGMFARTLTLDCPMAESGKETISADSPIALPEAALAVRSGKQPRRAGLTLVRHGEQYELTLQAESFSIGGAKMTRIDKSTPSDNPAEDRITSIRSLTETVDMLFEAFCARRIGKAWKAEFKAMQSWLQSDSGRSSRKPAA